MKKAQITVSYDEEKLAAITMYLVEKGVSVESEIEKAIDSIYNKTVPVGVREFISRRNGGSLPKAKKTKPVSSSAVGVKSKEDEG